MDIMKLFEWNSIVGCRPRISKFYRVCDIYNKRNWAYYDAEKDVWERDCSEFGLDELVYWKEHSYTRKINEY